MTDYFYRKEIRPRRLGEWAAELVDIVRFYRVEKRTLKTVTLREVAVQITPTFGGRSMATPSTRPDAVKGSPIRRQPRKDGSIELEKYVWLSPWDGKAIEVRQ